MPDKDTERIKYETELLKLMALFILAIGGSAIGLLLGERTATRLFLTVLGSVGSVVLILGVWRQHRIIRKLLAESKEAAS